MNRGIKCRMIAAALMSVLVLGGCGEEERMEPDGNLIGSGLEFGSDQIMITISNDSTSQQPSLSHFVAAVRERYPDVILVQTGYSGSYENKEHIARVNAGDLSDIVMVKAGRKVLVDMSPQLLDLSNQSFPGNFNHSSLEKNSEGRIYYIPGPLSLNGIIYNKTLFEERGWKVPGSFEELIEVSRQIDSEGIRGMQYSLSASSMPLYAYTVCAALDIMTTPEGQNWHEQFLAGKNVSLDPMEEAFDNFEVMIDAGFFRPEDLKVKSDERNENMIQRKTAMTDGEAGSILSYNKQSQDEFEFLPHFGRGNTGEWMLNLGFYFGANKNLEAPGNEKKCQAVMDILEFISTEEGQQALVDDGYGLISSVRGADIPDEPILEEVHDLIAGGRYVMRPVFYRFNSVLEPGIASLLNGEITAEILLDECQAIMDKGVPQLEALGTAEDDFSVLETGIYKAAALREATETDVALMGMAEINMITPVNSTRSRFYKGAVTMDDVLRVADEKGNDPNRCSRAVISGAGLLAILESGAIVEGEEAGHFHPYAVSGLTMSYHLNGAEGERITDVELADGSKLDPGKIYRVSWLRGAMPEDGFSSVEHMDMTLAEALENKIGREQTVQPEAVGIKFDR